jgi:FkbM family methyltransferase
VTVGEGASDVAAELSLGAHGPISITGDARDTSVMSMLTSTRTYEPHVVSLLQSVLTPASVVLDIGANIGVHTLVASTLAREGRVFAFEPSTHHLEYLARNVAANGATNVVIERVAVMDVPGVVVLSMPKTFQAGSFISSDQREGLVEEVPAITIDHWARGAGVDSCDFVKIDIEGCEQLALAGAAESLRRWQPLLLVECNAVTQRRFRSMSLGPLFAALRQISRDLYALRASGELERLCSFDHLDRLVRDDGLVDVLCVPPRRRPALRGILGSWRRAVPAYASLLARHNRWRRPARTTLHDPSYDLEFEFDPELTPLRVSSGDVVRIPVKIHNTGPLWMSDQFAPGPTYLSYRWVANGDIVDGVGGPRTSFDSLRPGASAPVVLRVEADRPPGEYLLDVGVVQQDAAWLVDLAPRLACRVPITIM